MGRAIDKQTMLGLIIDAKRTDPETGSFAEWLAEYLAEHMPPLPPPNEPLTCEGCACKEYSRDSYPCNSCFRNDETLSDQYRPPEGEA